MIRIKEILRLKSMGINISAISRSCNCTRNTVREVLRRAEKHNLQWPLPDNCDDSGLMNLLYPTIATPTARKQEPDYEYIHRELGKPHVNLRLLGQNTKRLYQMVWNTLNSVTGIGNGQPKRKLLCTLHANLRRVIC